MYIYMHIYICIFLSRSVTSDSLWPYRLYNPWNSPGQNTEVGSLSLLQGIFPTQGSNPGLLHCTQVLYQLSHQGSPRILEWVAYPFSSRSSQPKNRTGVSCIACRLFTSWATREAHMHYRHACIYTHIHKSHIWDITKIITIKTPFNPHLGV